MRESVLGDGVEGRIPLMNYLVGLKLICLISNPLQQLQGVGIIYPILQMREGPEAYKGDVAGVRLLCLMNGEQE